MHDVLNVTAYMYMYVLSIANMVPSMHNSPHFPYKFVSNELSALL